MAEVLETGSTWQISVLGMEHRGVGLAGVMGARLEGILGQVRTL